MSGSDLSPSLLVAMPQLLDPNFHRAVVLLIDHDEGGTFGLVLNRGTDLPVAQLCASLGIEWQGREERSVEWGGPVQPEHGWLLMGEDAPGHLEVTDVMQGVRFSRSPDVLRECAEAPPRKFRIFLGYAGWGPGQLEAERAHGIAAEEERSAKRSAREDDLRRERRGELRRRRIGCTRDGVRAGECGERAGDEERGRGMPLHGRMLP